MDTGKLFRRSNVNNQCSATERLSAAHVFRWRCRALGNVCRQSIPVLRPEDAAYCKCIISHQGGGTWPFVAVTPTALVAFPAAGDFVHGSGQFSDPPGLSCVICEADLLLLIVVFDFYFQNCTAKFMVTVTNWKVVKFLPPPACLPAHFPGAAPICCLCLSFRDFREFQTELGVHKHHIQCLVYLLQCC